MRLAFLALLTFVLSTIGSPQGQLWNQQLDHNRVSIVRDSAGNIYAAGVINAANIVPAVSCYNAAGQLLFRYVSSTSFGASYGKVSEAHLSGTELLFTVTFDSTSSRLFRFDTTTQSLSFVSLQSSGSGISVASLAVSTSTYCVVGTRASDSNCVIQVRSLADDTLLREVVSTHDLSKVFRSGSVYYAIGKSSTPSSRVVVHRINETSNSFFSAGFPIVGLNYPLTGVLAGRTLFLISNYFSLSSFDLFVVPFSTLTLTFGNAWEENDVATESYLSTSTAIGGTRVFLGLRNRAISIDATGALVFDVPYPSFAGLNGSSATDDVGNAVCVLQGSGENRLFRFSPTGSILNWHVVGLPACDLAEMRLDSAGVARFTYAPRDVPYSDRWFLGAVAQAGLNLPGPYTVGGNNLVGTISLGGPAPTGGATFDLFSNNTSAVVPTTVTIPAGQTSANFTITTAPVSSNAKPTINARYNGVVLQNNFDLAAPLVQSVTATPQSQYGGVNITGTVNITGNAPSGGKTVNLTSSNTSRVTVPTSVNVPAGSSSVNFTMTTFPTLVNASSVVTATTGAVSKTVFVAVIAPVFQNATLATNSIKGGLSTTMTLTIGTPAPSGYTITLVSGATGFVQLPSSFAIPAGQTTVNVPVSTSPVTSNTPVTLFAYRGPYIKTMTLTVTP